MTWIAGSSRGISTGSGDVSVASSLARAGATFAVAADDLWLRLARYWAA